MRGGGDDTTWRLCRLTIVITVMAIRVVMMISVVIVGQLLHVDGRRIVGAVHAVHVETLAALQRLVGTSWLSGASILQGMMLYVVDNRNVDC